MNNVNPPMTMQNPYSYSTYNDLQSAFNSMNNAHSVINGYQPKTGFKNHDFKNNNELLHNNLNSILLNEEIREYSVLIDSKDRNYQVYTDPFSYNVQFNPLPKSTEIIDGEKVIYAQPNPVINDEFVNVRYIKLEYAILPYFNKIRAINKQIDDEIVKIWQVDTKQPLTENLYNVLSIGKGEYTDTNYRSTNDVLSDSFAVVYFDKRINDTHYMASSKNGIKYFPPDQLGSIKQLQINFMDPYGKLIKSNHLKRGIKSNMECDCVNPNGDTQTNCFRHNLFHPLNPIFQHHLHFKVGVVEPRLSKHTFN